jgi:hypothetical protein
LKQDDDVALDVVLHAEALFAENPRDPQAPLRFDPIADADARGDGDGVVTLDELGQVPLSELQTDTAYGKGDGAMVAWTTLEDFIYLGTAPSMARYQETGKCILNLRNVGDD